MSNIKLGKFPSTRLRRLRMKDFTRRMISENNLSVNDLIWPIFVCEGNNIADEIKSMLVPLQFPNSGRDHVQYQHRIAEYLQPFLSYQHSLLIEKNHLLKLRIELIEFVFAFLFTCQM